MECLCGYAVSEGWGVGEQRAIATRCILFLLYTWEVGTLPKWGILGERERIENFLSLKHKVVRNEDRSYYCQENTERESCSLLLREIRQGIT